MATKRSGIQWRDSDEERLTKAVRNYNAKLDRLAKRDPALRDALPERLSKRELKNKIENRQDYNKFVNSAQRFTRKGSETVIANDLGLRITKYERREIGIKLGIINKQRSRQLEKFENMEVFNQGVPTGMKRKEMGTARLKGFKPKKVNFAKMTKQSYKMFTETLNKQAMSNYVTKRNQEYKTNYIKALKDMVPPRYDFLITIIKAMPLDRFMDTYFSDENAVISFIYDPVGVELKAKILTQIWTVS
jgi:hypothetical protein